MQTPRPAPPGAECQERSERKRKMKTTGTIMAGAIAFGAMCMLAGCKETYENPGKFIDKYVIQDCVNTIWTPEFLAECKLKGPFVSDLKLEQEMSFVGAVTVVSAKLRFEPVDRKAVYIQRPVFPKMPYATAQVKTADKLGDTLEAAVAIPRSKMDNGVFAPAVKISRDTIQGWGTVGALELVDPKKCEAGVAQLLKQYGNEANQYEFLKYAKAYATNGQLEYVHDKELLQLFADYAVAIKASCEKGRYANSRSTRQDLAGVERLLEMLKAKGASLRNIAADNEAVLKTVAQKGRNLFMGVIQANVEREAAGWDSVWPKTTKTASGDPEDISGRVFKNSTEYFNTLFDIANAKKADWAPYVSAVDIDCALYEGKSRWNVAAGVTDEMEDAVPMFISANFDCRNLPKGSYDGKKDADKIIPIGTCPVLGNSGIVVINKGGAANYIPASRVSLGTIFCGQSVHEMPESYLAP